MFNPDKLAKVVADKIKEMAEKHSNETFYAFTIAGSHLCLNSIVMFQRTLKKQKLKFPDKYKDPNNLRHLKFNTQNWAYNDFYTLTDEDGFDRASFEKHCTMSMSDQLTSDYMNAMKKVLEILNNASAFDCLDKTSDFISNITEHVSY
jgi:hypothetical protein